MNDSNIRCYHLVIGFAELQSSILLQILYGAPLLVFGLFVLL